MTDKNKKLLNLAQANGLEVYVYSSGEIGEFFVIGSTESIETIGKLTDLLEENRTLRAIVAGLIKQAETEPFCSVGHWVEHGPDSEFLADVRLALAELQMLEQFPESSGTYKHNTKNVEQEICPNCDTALPQGCGGLFRNDGHNCWLNKAPNVPQNEPNNVRHTQGDDPADGRG